MSIVETKAQQESSWHVDRWIWQWCSSKSTLLLFLVPLILALAASYLLPQIPAQIRSDPIRYQERLTAIQVQFKNWTPFLEDVGAFAIEDTLWFRLLLVLFGFVVLVSLGKEIGSLVESQPINRLERFDGSPDTFTTSTSLPADQVVEAIQELIENRVGHAHHETQDAKVYLYGGRAAWARVGTAVTYLGLLFLVAGLAANGRWGWRQENVRVPPNQAISIGPDGDRSIRLVSVQVGETKAVGRLVWLNDRATNGERPRFHLWVFGEDGLSLLADQEFVVSESRTSDETLVAEIGDVIYILDVTQYVIMNVAYQPGLWPLWIGGALLVAGLSLSLVPRRQIWALIVPEKGGHRVRMRTKSQSFRWQKRRDRAGSWAQLCTDVEKVCAGNTHVGRARGKERP
jgi:cytochrome c biogenesis protein ResB